MAQDIPAEVLAYIESSRQEGMDWETIRKRLLEAGWPEETVKKALMPAVRQPTDRERQQKKGFCATCGKKLLWWWYWGIPIWIVAEVGPRRFCSFGFRQAFLKEYHEEKRKRKG